MNKKLQLNLAMLTTMILLFTSGLFSQTTGTFTFTFTTTSSGGYTPKHLLAVWVQNSSNTFIKTKMKYCSSGNLDHLSNWTTASNQNVVDATTGATLTSHGTRTVIWNGTDVSGNVVPDGTYKIWVEMAWASSLTTGKTTQSFTFTKGPSVDHQTPANLTNFTGITLDWTPTSTAVTEVSTKNEISVFPNPTTGLINLDLKENLGGNIQVLNSLGAKVFEENAEKEFETIDLSEFPNGIYFINIKNGDKSSIHKVLLNK